MTWMTMSVRGRRMSDMCIPLVVGKGDTQSIYLHNSKEKQRNTLVLSLAIGYTKFSKRTFSVQSKTSGIYRVDATSVTEVFFVAYCTSQCSLQGNRHLAKIMTLEVRQ